MVYGKLTAIKQTGKTKNYIPILLCICECGTKKNIRLDHLKAGKIKSCGCLVLKHGLHGSRTYRIWYNMVQRCTNSKASNYKYYGAKGVTVCTEWLKFENFLADMGTCPDNLTLDRENPYLNYNKNNCRWADSETQANNKRVHWQQWQPIIDYEI